MDGSGDGAVFGLVSRLRCFSRPLALIGKGKVMGLLWGCQSPFSVGFP